MDQVCGPLLLNGAGRLRLCMGNGATRVSFQGAVVI